jgi:alpha,alpha-trehalase
MSLGYHDEAMAFWEWLQRLRLVEGGPLQNVYRIDGAAEIPEMTLSHLEGYAQSRPVRVGNGAAAQRQLDVHGEVLAAAYTCVTGMKTTPHARFGGVLRYLAERAASDWKLPDQGIWEMRTPPRHFVHSKLLCWVALDRALRLAELGVLEGPLSAWRRAREQICTAILERGLDQKSGAFTQSFDDSALDASALVIPFVGFLEPHDPRVRATVEKIRERLTSNGLVYRYVDTDGLPRGEAAFGLCTLWLAEALALEGRLDDAHEAFARVTRFANDVGLLSEQLDASTGGLRGNFPQAFTHLALIRAARGLADAAKPQPRAIRSFGLVKEK